ncbi:MAG: hypothetical protein E3K37_01445 [Candidatus Kuenenia sp.]|nr:hypothetical protein [Candidatus Kuenenia hertensis]
METLTDTIASIKYQKNGYLIAKTASGVSVKGNMPGPQLGLEYTFEGKWGGRHPLYGKPFVFESYTIKYPKEISAIHAYLIDNAKWIGFQIAKKLTDAYGEDTLEVCKNEPERVAREISGITEARAREISAMLLQNQVNEELQLQLKTIFQGVQVNRRVVANIISLYGQDAVVRTKENPYALIGNVEGVGFLTADRIAINVGYAKDGEARIKAGIRHILKEAGVSGHTCLPIEALIEQSASLLGLSTDSIEKEITNMEVNSEIIMYENYAYLPNMYENERLVADKLKELAAC